jgi:hypothetical protein
VPLDPDPSHDRKPPLIRLARRLHLQRLHPRLPAETARDF